MSGSRWPAEERQLSHNSLIAYRRTWLKIIAWAAAEGLVLEGLNKRYGSSIIASDTIVDRANEAFDFRLLDVVAVKGKSDPITIYELLGTKGALEHCRHVVSAYETAFSAYAAGKFERALAVLQENASDPPNTVLIERCKAFLQVPPPADWRGIYISASK